MALTKYVEQTAYRKKYLFWFEASEVLIFYSQEAMTERVFQILTARKLRGWSTGRNHGKMQSPGLNLVHLAPSHACWHP